MFERCWLIAWRSGYRTDLDLAATLALATDDAAAVLGLPNYGIAPGANANILVVPAEHVAQAIVDRVQPHMIIRNGFLIYDGADLAQSRLPRLQFPAGS
jgi:cytosine deaminase